MRNTLLVLFVIVLVAPLTAGRCAEKADESEERRLCDDLSAGLCAKWFECWPVISADWWDDVETCEVSIKANCSNSEQLYECDLDNEELEECADGVDGSACGSLPQSCHDFVECQ
jgi:hypothetical protein